MATSREYIVSLNGKSVVSVCDNCVFVKELPALAETFRDAERGFPYAGAKEHYILDMEDRALLDEVVPLLDEHMPLSKPRKSKRSIIPRYRKAVVPGTHTAENHDLISSDQGSRSSTSKSLLCSARSGNMLSR